MCVCVSSEAMQNYDKVYVRNYGLNKNNPTGEFKYSIPLIFILCYKGIIKPILFSIFEPSTLSQDQTD